MEEEDMGLATSTPLLIYPTVPKLNRTTVRDGLTYLQEDSHRQSCRPTISEVVEEIKRLYTIAFPMIITGLLIFGKSVISMFFMGKLGKEALAGGSLSIGIANITGYSIISGLAMGMEPISSQACGAKQWTLMAQTMQRTVFILLYACIPISLLWLNVEPILLFCRQESAISSIAATHLAFSLPSFLFQSLANPLKIFLRTQNVTLPLMLSAAIALALHAPLNIFFVYWLGLGIRGVAVAAAITELNLLATLLIYLSFSGFCIKSWEGWSIECFRGWKSILSLALPSCLSVCLEWWWYELMIVFSGLLPDAAGAVAAMGILLQATSLVYIFPSALSLAVSTRVGNELGANQPGRAYASSLIGLSCAAFTGCAAMLLVKTMTNAWGRIFTAEEAILSLTAAAMPVVGLCELGNSPQTAGCGVLRGSARPSLAAKINLGSFYVVGLPMAVVFAFVMEMGLLGLWLGLLSSQVVCTLLMVIVLMRTNWVLEANRARELIGINENR